MFVPFVVSCRMIDTSRMDLLTVLFGPYVLIDRDAFGIPSGRDESCSDAAINDVVGSCVSSHYITPFLLLVSSHVAVPKLSQAKLVSFS